MHDAVGKGAVLMIMLTLAGCSTTSRLASCSTADIDLVRVEKGRYGHVGVFSVRNAGGVALYFPLDDAGSHSLHGAYYDTYYLTPGEQAWAYPVWMGSWIQPTEILKVGRGDTTEVRAGVEVAFGTSYVSGTQFSVQFRDEHFRCPLRSTPFTREELLLDNEDG